MIRKHLPLILSPKSFIHKPVERFTEIYKTTEKLYIFMYKNFCVSMNGKNVIFCYISGAKSGLILF